MKQFTVASMASIAVAGPSAKCLYCKRNDENSGFLNSWSYCKKYNTCLHNVWNYIQRPCEDDQGGWQHGSSYLLDYCEPEDIACPEYESAPEKYQTYSNNSWTLVSGGKCTIKIDATKGVARVVFDDNVTNSKLGMMYEGYKVGDVISFDSGVNEIVLYNAAESGPLNFDVSFSAASYLVAAGSAIAAILSF